MPESVPQDRNLEGNSTSWANWQSVLALNTCLYCAENHGRIVPIIVLNNNLRVQAHMNCKCVYVPMRTKRVGTATESGQRGPDVYIMFLKILPDYYVTKEVAENAGWLKYKGNLAEVLPGNVIGGNIYKNNDGKLPSASGRIWYEADINYTEGFRNHQRLLYSNDGLVFVSYDHYQTFYEITH